ncbi:MAG TPA: class IV adenylate cyclase [Dehalococcoidia bacterium]|nr:class IV adenylate cyclase [Dehalococcoidia bacterium]
MCTPSFVYYERDELAPQRPSDYETVAVADAAALRDMLTRAFGVAGVVRKRRTLLLLDTTRIHLDNVDLLGDFLEFEAPVKDDEAAARRQLDSLIEAFGFSAADGIRASYIDLVLAEQGSKA